tara:strand:+ start:1455 stop:2291 length:837 start_codon:yes stop_codon:yes gene_type:complete
MSQQTRRAGRPKKATAEAVIDAPAPETKAKKKAPILRKEVELEHTMWEIPKGGGIAFMIQQRGITVFDKEKDTIRQMRYCPNENSIWVDEQSENAKKEAVIFRNGKLMVPKEKPNLRKFLENHPQNMANGGTTFKIVNETKKAEDELAKEFSQVEAVAAVRDKDIQELLPVAIFYGLNIDRSTSDIRYDLLKIAKKKPTEFIKAFDSPQVVARSVIRQAADYQIIDLRQDGAYWFDSNGLIVSTPVGQKSIDVLTRFCLTEKGSSVLASLEERLERLA